MILFNIYMIILLSP